MTKMKWKKWSALGCSFALAAFLGFMIPSGVTRAAEMASAPTVTVQCGGRPLNVQTPNGQTVTYQVHPVGSDPTFAVYATGADSLSYFLETAKEEVSKNADALESLTWTSLPEGNQVPLGGSDGYYTLYLKADGDSGTTYFFSDGIIRDTKKPVFNGIQHGGLYFPSKTFTVTDDTAVTVRMNDVVVSPDSEGRYTVKARENSSDCKVTATDAADNTITISITIVNTAISAPNTYSLESKTPYQLIGGFWQVENSAVKDPSVYESSPNGIVVYVRDSGSYTLHNYWNFDWSTWWKNWWKQQ